MISPRITYTPRNDTSAKVEAAALANVYRFVLDSANKNAAGVTSTNGGDAKERSEDDSSARSSIPDR
jgi:hypothetical protein